MPADLAPGDRAKFACAWHAAQLVRPGMRVGLGTGSTAVWLVRALGQRVHEEGLAFQAVPTSTRTADLARDVGIEVVTLEAAGWLDLTIDGADEFDGNMNLIKGGGGAHLQEKIVATASDRMVVIADAGKSVGTLGAFPLPVEVIPFGWQATERLVARTLAGMDVAARETALRQQNGVPFRTDEGNVILDLHLDRIGDPAALAAALNQVPGIVENGLFLDICDTVVVGHEDGKVEVRQKGATEIAVDHVDLSHADGL